MRPLRLLTFPTCLAGIWAPRGLLAAGLVEENHPETEKEMPFNLL